jgi:glycosyltransferase involved in cell wall biosynthesis
MEGLPRFARNDASASPGNDGPVFTVLMPVWRTPVEKLRKAVNSILDQNFRDFELLIVDDNNTDDLLIREFEDLKMEAGRPKSEDRRPKIRVVRTSENKGLAAALDFGLRQAKGSLIVRMDSDDVAHPELLDKHYEFMGDHPKAVICGVQLNLMLSNGQKRGVTSHPAIVDKRYALSKNIFWLTNHPGICYRKDVVIELGGYGDTPKQLAEDYALWIRFLKAGYVINNLPDVLIDYSLGDGTQCGQERQGKEWKEWLEKCKNDLRI